MDWAANEAITRHKALQSQGELTALLSVLEAVQPKVILEVGTWAGGSAWAFSRVTSVESIVTVDASPQPEAASVIASLPCKATLIVGDSNHPDTAHRVQAALEAGPPDVLVIDAAHDYKTTSRDWQIYQPLVRAGGLVVVHDTQGYPGVDMVQTPQLWAELRQQYRTTELVDKPGGPAGTGIVWL